MSCCYLPSQLHACLLCLAMPCLAFPFFLSLFFPLLLHQFPWRTDGRMTKFFPCFFATCKLAFGAAPNTRDSVCLLRVVKSVSQEETTAAGSASRH